jgi:hypothetical protein
VLASAAFGLSGKPWSRARERRSRSVFRSLRELLEPERFAMF